MVVGRPPDHLHVHHINHDPSDNRPENLQIMTAREHQNLHVPITWDADEAIKLYRAGASFPELGRRYGVNAVTVLRAFRVRGVKSRPAPKDKTHCDNGHEFTPKNTYYWTSRTGTNHRQCRSCRNVAARKARLSA